MTYLHTNATGVHHLDHRLTPEVRAMLCAMSSRMPAGGIEARYEEIVLAVAEGIWDEVTDGKTWAEANSEEWAEVFSGQVRHMKRRAEERLTTYPLHPKVQVFFDKFVKMYGHSSIMELTGSPSVYMEGISYYDAWLLFDNPLVAGQEFSTRAVRHKNWPMARSCYIGPWTEEALNVFKADSRYETTSFPNVPHPGLLELHYGWFEVFEAEVDWWKEHLSVEANRLALGIADKEPFRPALDHARWAIPGTISTGCAHTGNLRTMARVLQAGSLLAQKGGAPIPIGQWAAFQEGYEAAIPGLAEMGLREAVYDESTRIPAHQRMVRVPLAPEVQVKLHLLGEVDSLVVSRPEDERAYLDAAFNQTGRADITYQCSLAVARDWHRHRTLFPWFLGLVRRSVETADTGTLADIEIHDAYEPKSDLAKEKLPGLLRKSTQVYDDFMEQGNQLQAMLALPLGTRVQMKGSGGLRDVVYMLELRGFAHGANFEYKAQALQAIEQLQAEMPDEVRALVGM